MLADRAVLFGFPSIIPEYNGPLEAAHAHIDDDSTIWLNVVLRASPNWTSQISYEAVACLLLAPSICAVQICFMDAIVKYNGSSEAAHAHIDDNRYNMAE